MSRNRKRVHPPKLGDAYSSGRYASIFIKRDTTNGPQAAIRKGSTRTICALQRVLLHVAFGVTPGTIDTANLSGKPGCKVKRSLNGSRTVLAALRAIEIMHEE